MLSMLPNLSLSGLLGFPGRRTLWGFSECLLQVTVRVSFGVHGSRAIGSQGRKWAGFPDEGECGIGKYGGIRANFISRCKQRLSKDLSDDLQNNCVFFSGPKQCPNGVFMVLGSHMARFLFKITFKENALQKLKTILKSH